MVLKEKYCDTCKYRVCSEEEYENASKEQRQIYRVKWNHHINSKAHNNEVSLQRRMEYYHHKEGKEEVLNALLLSIQKGLNTRYRHLLPEGKYVKCFNIEYHDESSMTKYVEPILKDIGFLPTK